MSHYTNDLPRRLRRIAAGTNPQPLHDAAQLIAAAGRLEELESVYYDLRDALQIALKFMEGNPDFNLFDPDARRLLELVAHVMKTQATAHHGVSEVAMAYDPVTRQRIGAIEQGPGAAYRAERTARPDERHVPYWAGFDNDEPDEQKANEDERRLLNAGTNDDGVTCEEVVVHEVTPQHMDASNE